MPTHRASHLVSLSVSLAAAVALIACGGAVSPPLGGTLGDGGADGACDCGVQAADVDAGVCPDGSRPISGCGRDASGACGWFVAPCPAVDAGSETRPTDGGACTTAECGPMPVVDCEGGGSPPEYCERQTNGTCAWWNPACPVPDGGNHDDGIDTGHDAGIPDGFVCPADACGPIPPIPCEPCADGSCAGLTCAPSGGTSCGWTLTCGTTVVDAGPPDVIWTSDTGIADAIVTGDATFICDAESCGPPPPGPCFACADGTCGELVCAQNGPTSCGWSAYCPTSLDAGASDGGSSTPPSQPCGGFGGFACGKGQYCDYSIAAMCGDADATGTCESIPDTCSTVYAPVCGCDGKTYPNACSAAAASVSVHTPGVCGK